MTLRPHWVIPIICVLLTGCVLPQVTHTTVASSFNSSYRDTEVKLEQSHLSVLINDPSIKSAEFEKMKLIEAVLVTSSGKEIDLGRPFYTGYGIGVTYAFDLGKFGYTEDNFGLRITVNLNGRRTTISGKFSDKAYFQIRNMEDDLDPGGR